MAREISEPVAGAGGERRLRDLWGALARRWPRQLALRRLRLTRFKLAVLGVLGVVFLLWSAVTALSTTTYSTTVLFTEGGGIGIPPPLENLDFGDVPRGMDMHRNVILENNGKLDAFVVVITWGGIRDFLHVDDAFFNLGTREKHNVDFSVYAPANMPESRHSGRVFIVRLPWWWPF